MKTLRLFLCNGVLLLGVTVFFSGCEKNQPEAIPSEKPKAPEATSAEMPKVPKVKVFPKEVITLKIPAGHKHFTAVIDDSNGIRIRNLLSMALCKEHGGNPESGKEQTVTVSWDGLNEEGKPAPPGIYSIRGLSLQGLKALYEYSFYNPGTPPWQGYPGSGWAGDHSQPTGIACARKGTGHSWKIAISSPGAEGGDPIFALNNDLKKVWAYKKGWDGSRTIDIADDMVWITISGSNLMRFKMDTGKVVPFQRPAGSLGVVDLKGSLKGPPDAFSLAVGPDSAVISMDKTPTDEPRLIFVDKQTGKIIKEIPCEPKAFLAYSPSGQLHVSTIKGIFIIDSTGSSTPVTLPELTTPGGLAFDDKGNLYVMDLGPDQQIKIYGQDLKLIRTIGEKEGQKKSGLEYNPQALHEVKEIDVDVDGLVWAVENHNPCRISVWGLDGKLTRDFVGNAHYGGYNCALHEQDPTITLAYTFLLKVDPKEVQSYKPWRYLSSAQKEGSPFRPFQSGPPYWFANARIFRSQVSGKMHEYYVDTASGWMVLYVSKNGDYRPVLAVFSNNTSSGHPAIYSRDSAATMYVWSDLNGDEKIQDNEVQAFPQESGYKGFSGWTYLMSPDFSLYTKAHALAPARFTDSGIPVYDMSKIQKLNVTLEGGSSPFMRLGQHLFKTDDRSNEKGEGFLGWHTFADLTGKTIARYKTSGQGVHGSMNQPVYGPGQPLGELFVSGVVHVNDDIGSVLATHGNLGQAYFFTEDGLFISHIFKDARNNPRAKGPSVIRGDDWTDITMEQECFGGWFGKQNDGVIRYMHGHLAPQVVQLKGFEDIRRFKGGNVEIK